MKDKLLEYKAGLTQQMKDAYKQAHMIEGALQFIDQLLSEIEEGEQSPSDEEENE